MIDLTSLPAPVAIETLSYEDILAALITDVTARFAAAGVDYDVGNLETDPAKIILEAAAYREVLLRARINDAVRSNILSKSTGADLEQLAAIYGVTRLTGELDDRLRERTVLAITGLHAAGTEEAYTYAALTADVDVAEAKVYRVGGGPQIGITILSAVNGGVPDQDMLDAVEAAVTSLSVRSVNDVITVGSAASQTVNIAADIWLLPNTPMAVFNGLEASLRAAWVSEGGIGFDLVRSWIDAKLHAAGVAKVSVTAPAADVVADDNHAIALGTVTLTFKGVSR